MKLGRFTQIEIGEIQLIIHKILASSASELSKGRTTWRLKTYAFKKFTPWNCHKCVLVDLLNSLS